jgi:hypothetical protein
VPFACSICEQESTRICAYCTKDACDNHLCTRCGCCSDCCQCEVPLEEPVHGHAATLVGPDAAPPKAPSAIESPPLNNSSLPAEAQLTPPDESDTEPLETPEV